MNHSPLPTSLTCPRGFLDFLTLTLSAAFAQAGTRCGRRAWPASTPPCRRLDDAVPIDVALQLLRDKLADYEDLRRFQRVAADFAGIAVDAVPRHLSRRGRRP